MKMQIKGYRAIISSDCYGDGSVLIGVVEKGHPCDAYFDSDDADSEIYFYLSDEDMANLKVGDVLNDGEDFTIVEIDKDEPFIFEVEYDEKEFTNAVI